MELRVKTTRIDVAVGEILNKDSKMIRFYGARMAIEITLGRRLTPKEAHKLFNKCRIGILTEGQVHNE